MPKTRKPKWRGRMSGVCGGRVAWLQRSGEECLSSRSGETGWRVGVQALIMTPAMRRAGFRQVLLSC